MLGKLSVPGPGRVAQSVGYLTRKSGILGSIPGLATYFRFSFRFFKKGSCQLLAKVLHKVLVNRLGGLSLPRKSVVRLTDRPDMTLDVYCGRKTTIQQQNNNSVPGRPTYFDYSRARAYCACSRCGWGLFGHFSSRLSVSLFFLSLSLSLSLGDGGVG